MPPSWIFHFRLWSYIIATLVSLDYWTIYVWPFESILFNRNAIQMRCYSLEDATLVFPILRTSAQIILFQFLPVWSYITSTSRPENLGRSIRIRIAVLSRMDAEKTQYLFRDDNLIIWSRSIANSPVQLLDSENTGVAVGITLLSSQESEIFTFSVGRPPSWILHFQFFRFGIAGLLNPEIPGKAAGIALLFSLTAKIAVFVI